jgi:hypothetical protein
MDGQSGALDTFLQRMEQVVAALGHAAGTEAHVDLDRPVAAPARGFGGAGARGAAGLPGQEFAKELWHFFSARVAERVLVDLHHGSQRAAPQARDRLNGELAVRIRVLVGRDAQMAAQGFLDSFHAIDVTRGTATHVHDMFAHGAICVVAEMRRRAASGSQP